MMVDRAARVLAGAIAGLALAGCATPVYGPIGAKSPFGYRDTRNPDGTYTVLVIAADPTTAHAYWDRRAKELCGEKYRKNIFRAHIPVVSYSGYATNGYTGGSYTEDRRGAPELEGYLRCEPADVAAAAVAPAPAEAPTPVVVETAPAAGPPSSPTSAPPSTP